MSCDQFERVLGCPLRENSPYAIEAVKMEMNSVKSSIDSKKDTLKHIAQAFIAANSALFFIFFKNPDLTNAPLRLALALFAFLNFLLGWALLSVSASKLSELYALYFYRNRLRRKVLKQYPAGQLRDLVLDFCRNVPPRIPETVKKYVPYIIATYNFITLCFFLVLSFKGEDYYYSIGNTLFFMMIVLLIYPNICTRFWIRTVFMWKDGVKFTQIKKIQKNLQKIRKKRKWIKSSKQHYVILFAIFFAYIMNWYTEWVDSFEPLRKLASNEADIVISVILVVLFAAVRVSLEFNFNGYPLLKPCKKSTGESELFGTIL